MKKIEYRGCSYVIKPLPDGNGYWANLTIDGISNRLSIYEFLDMDTPEKAAKLAERWVDRLIELNLIKDDGEPRQRDLWEGGVENAVQTL